MSRDLIYDIAHNLCNGYFCQIETDNPLSSLLHPTPSGQQSINEEAYSLRHFRVTYIPQK